MLALAVIILSTVVTGACGRSEAKKLAQPELAGAKSAIPVTTVTASLKQLQSSLEVTGTFFPFESSDVAPEITGRVSAVYVDVGKFVKKGDVIAKLDDRDVAIRLQQAEAAEEQALAALRQAEAKIGLNANKEFDTANIPEVRVARASFESAQSQAKLAETNANRYATLVKTGDVSRSVYDQAQTQAETAQAQARAAKEQYEAAINQARQSNQGVAAARAALKAAQAQVADAKNAIAYTSIKAPFDGYVTDRPIAVGEYVTSQSKIVTLQSIDILKLVLLVPEAEAAAIKINAPVLAKVAAYPDREFPGKVNVISPSLETSSRALILVVGVLNKDMLLRPGMFATARIVKPTGGQESVFVPRTAVVNDTNNNATYVYVLNGNTVRVRIVQLGVQDGDMIEIKSGLSSGEVIAASNLSQLYDGAPVERQ